MTAGIEKIVSYLNKRYANGSTNGHQNLPFSISYNGHERQLVGKGRPTFNIAIQNKNGINAFHSMDDTKILEGYMKGDIDVEGEFLQAFELRGVFKDNHPVRYLWCFLRPLIYGQVSSDRKWIAEHYDLDQDFYLMFLDKRHRCYSHGVFANDDESLEDAMSSKLEFALQAIDGKPGDRVLDIGGGWGAFVEYAGSKGIHVTSLTIAKESETFVNNIIKRQNLPCKILKEHLYEHQPEQLYDAIVNLGVTEHLPNYAMTLKKYKSLVKPGGRIYLDASASRTKFGFHSFIYRYIYPGNYSPMCLHDYITQLDKTDFQLLEVLNDRYNYYLTTKRWAENLESNRENIINRWDKRLFRRFQIYLWGCVDVFKKDIMQAYRVVLQAGK